MLMYDTFTIFVFFCVINYKKYKNYRSKYGSVNCSKPTTKQLNSSYLQQEEAFTISVLS